MQIVFRKGRLCFVDESGKVIPPAQLSASDRALLRPMRDSYIEVDTDDLDAEDEEDMFAHFDADSMDLY